MSRFIKQDIKGVRTEDHDTYYGYSSGFFHNELQHSKSRFAGELSSSLIDYNKSLKGYYKTAIAKDIANVKKRRS